MSSATRAARALVATSFIACQGIACQGQGAAPPRAQDAAAARATGDAGGVEPQADAGADVDENDAEPQRTAKATIARLGAIAVWEGVVQRASLLSRRGQRGTLFGRVGPPVGESTWVWLIDDTEGNGSLAARAAFPGAPPAAGSAVAATGAWSLEEVPAEPAATPVAPPPPATAAPPPPATAAPPKRRWVWQVESVVALPGADPAQEEPSIIGHEPASAPRPPTAVPISRAKDNDLVVFVVLAAPKTLGEGWVIADALGNPPVAVLYLPGDRPSYGGIDFRQPDEVWRLRRGGMYVVRIGRVRKKDPTKPAQINARGAPIKVS